MKRTLLFCLLVFCTTITPVFGAPSCDQCKDLPFLFRELMQQEYLRDQFDSYVKQAYYPPTVGQMYTTVEKRFNTTFYSSAESAASPGSADAAKPAGGAAFGTRTWLKNCDLVEFVKDANGNQVLDEKKNPVVKPITQQQIRGKECKAIADHVLTHEGHHQKSCRETHDNGTANSWDNPEFVAKNEVEAYQKGIASLRETIARLSKECHWEGSTRTLKPDGTSVVPTKEQIEELKNNTRKVAKSLRKAKR
jgi:hypothetical protein